MSRPAVGPRAREFAQIRAQAEIDTRMLRARAARTVAGQALDDDDRARLLSMLGLEDTPKPPRTFDRGAGRGAGPETVSLLELERELAGYVHTVATYLAVPAEATGYEVSDTITAYLGLPDRRAECASRELMLVWNEWDGWLVAAETRPTEPPWVIGYLGGHDIVPHPDTVAQFVTNLRSGHHPSRARPIHPSHTPRRLAILLSRHHAPHPRPTLTIRHLGALP